MGNEILLCWEQLLEQTPFNLCSAQLQLRWYGLRSISMSCMDKHPSKTCRSIMSAAPVAILSSLSYPFLSPLWVCEYWLCAFVGKGTQGWGEGEVLNVWIRMFWTISCILKLLYREGARFLNGNVGVIKRENGLCSSPPWKSREVYSGGFLPKQLCNKDKCFPLGVSDSDSGA